MGRSDGYGYQDYELVAGETHGVRAFNVDKLGRLGSVYKTDFVWRPGVNVARCERCERNAFLVPGQDCSCGFYAFFDPDRSDYESPERIVGVVRMTGRTIIGDEGLRGEKGEVVALCIPGPRTAKRDKRRPKGRRQLPWMAYAGLYKDGFIAWMIHSMLTAVALIASVVTLATGGDLNLLWLFVPLAAVNGLAAGSIIASVGRHKATKTVTLNGLVYEEMSRRLPLVRRNYPGVRIFESRSEMVAAYAMASDLVARSIDPDNDPNFWTRKVSG